MKAMGSCEEIIIILAILRVEQMRIRENRDSVIELIMKIRSRI